MGSICQAEKAMTTMIDDPHYWSKLINPINDSYELFEGKIVTKINIKPVSYSEINDQEILLTLSSKENYKIIPKFIDMKFTSGRIVMYYQEDDLNDLVGCVIDKIIKSNSKIIINFKDKNLNSRTTTIYALKNIQVHSAIGDDYSENWDVEIKS